MIEVTLNFTSKLVNGKMTFRESYFRERSNNRASFGDLGRFFLQNIGVSFDQLA